MPGSPVSTAPLRTHLEAARMLLGKSLLRPAAVVLQTLLRDLAEAVKRAETPGEEGQGLGVVLTEGQWEQLRADGKLPGELLKRLSASDGAEDAGVKRELQALLARAEERIERVENLSVDKSNLSALGIRLNARLNRMQKAHGAAVLLFDNDDLWSSLLVASDTIRLLDDALAALRDTGEENRAYVDMWVKNHFPKYEEDRTFLLDLFAEIRKDADAAVEMRRVSEPYYHALLRAGQMIGQLRKEVRRMFPQESLARAFVRRNKKRALTAAYVVAAALVLGFGTRFALTFGHGLRGEYYQGTGFEKLVRTRVDKRIKFNWGSGGPLRGVNDNFSIRWTGAITVPEDGQYRFFARSDDGIRLWINDTLVVENWSTHAPTLDGGTITLPAGRHKIRVDYFEKGQGAQLTLYWSPPSERGRTVIPARAFTPDAS